MARRLSLSAFGPDPTPPRQSHDKKESRISMHTNPLERPLSRAEIRRRVAGAPPSAAMVKHLLKTVAQLQQELAWLKNKRRS